MNKFVKQYPQLWIPNVGDKIRIIKYTFETNKKCFSIGDIGIIVCVLHTVVLQKYIVNFTSQGNKNVYGHGGWYVTREEMMLADE